MKYKKIDIGLKTTVEMLTWMAEIREGKTPKEISLRREKQQRESFML